LVFCRQFVAVGAIVATATTAAAVDDDDDECRVKTRTGRE
jgi:hypothetical protein